MNTDGADEKKTSGNKGWNMGVLQKLIITNNALSSSLLQFL